MAKQSIRPSTRRPKRVPRPILAMAAPSNDIPTVTLDRLKGGEINWSIKAPASTVGAARTRAIAEARLLIIECQALETLERNLRTAAREEAAHAVAEKAQTNGKEAAQ